MAGRPKKTGTIKDEMKKKELFAAVEKSTKSYEEIMAFLSAEK